MTFKELHKLNYVYIINHSGGKDSQAMYLYMKSKIPPERLIIIHAHLEGIEWEGTIDHIKNTTEHEFHVVQSKKKFLDMVEKRGMFPSPKYRQCTSDLKRSPINKKIRQICNERGFNAVINCTGIRAEESPNRAKKKRIKQNKTESNGKRIWFEYLPIRSWKIKKVFDTIKSHNQKPFWTYAKGLSRKSCCFCIMGNEKDLCIAAKLKPKLFEKYSALEKSTGQTMFMPSKKYGKRTMKQIIEQSKYKEALIIRSLDIEPNIIISTP